MAKREKTISRRELLGSLFYAVGQNAFESAGPSGILAEPQKGSSAHPKLFPPGAVSEERFTGLCDGCGDCARACPYDCIKTSQNGHPKAYIEPGKSPCRLCEALPCIAACANGALVAPESVSALRMGAAVIDEERCAALGGADCRLCAIRCPIEPKALYFNELGPVVDKSICTGCGICAEACSTVNDIAAIRILNR